MIGPPKESWERLVRATHLYEHGNPNTPDNKVSWSNPSKLAVIAIFLFVAAQQTDVITQFVFLFSVWLTSLEPLFTACAFGLAVIAGAARRELLGMGAAVILAAAYTGFAWMLFPAERSLGQFADWVFIRTWLATAYILVVAIVIRVIDWLRARYWPPAPTQDPPSSS
jgi:hypothetical protein